MKGDKMKPIIISSTFDTDAEFLFNFFLDSKLHAEITGGKAIINNKIGGKFTAWDGYIKGEIVSLEKNKKIIQKWRTTEFNKNDKDSILEITIEEINKKRSKLTLKHTKLPEGTEEEYKNGWKEYYIKPLKKFIIKQSSA
jgi:activator of HSP90 ATPase